MVRNSFDTTYRRAAHRHAAQELLQKVAQRRQVRRASGRLSQQGVARIVLSPMAARSDSALASLPEHMEAMLMRFDGTVMMQFSTEIDVSLAKPLST